MSNYIPKNDGSLMSEIIFRKNDTKVYVSNRKNNNFQNRDAKITDNKTFICPECDMGWEFLITNAGNVPKDLKRSIIYSENITRYKKQRKICGNCERAGLVSKKE